MDPAQRVMADVELAGVVADDHRALNKPCDITLPHSAPSVAILGASGRTSRAANSEAIEVAISGILVGEPFAPVRRQNSDHRPRKRSACM